MTTAAQIFGVVTIVAIIATFIFMPEKNYHLPDDDE